MLSKFLKTALILCSENKLRVHSFTFDGDASNCSAVNKLGVNKYFLQIIKILNIIFHILVTKKNTLSKLY